MIGQARVYEGETPPVYPGEQASALLTPFDLLRLEHGEMVTPTSWLITPSPGLVNLYRRWRWRLVYRWLERFGVGRPKLETTVTVGDEPR